MVYTLKVPGRKAGKPSDAATAPGRTAWPTWAFRRLPCPARRELHSVKESLHRTKGWLDGLSYALLAEEWDAGPNAVPGRH
jgi:hypothetical protein